MEADNSHIALALRVFRVYNDLFAAVIRSAWKDRENATTPSASLRGVVALFLKGRFGVAKRRADVPLHTGEVFCLLEWSS